MEDTYISVHYQTVPAKDGGKNFKVHFIMETTGGHSVSYSFPTMKVGFVEEENPWRDLAEACRKGGGDSVLGHVNRNRLILSSLQTDGLAFELPADIWEPYMSEIADYVDTETAKHIAEQAACGGPQ